MMKSPAFLPTCLLLLASTILPAMALERETSPLRDEVLDLVRQPDLASYAGWLDFQLNRTELYPTAENKDKLQEWVDRLRAGERPLPDARGYLEWAYLSVADHRGQPFSLLIPDDYDPSRACPLEIYLHGYGGDHFPKGYAPNDPADQSHPHDYFQLWPLGRARGGGYHGLGELDVFEAIDFVTSHWNIDPDQQHLRGGSMGAWGVMDLATRHPDRFASARIYVGSSASWPMHNLSNLPVFALSGGFDEIVPPLFMESGFHFHRDLGGPMVMYVDDRHGHGARFSVPTASDYDRVARQQRRQRDVHRIHYTGMDENARGAYWASVEEWGAEGKPATINLTVTGNNAIFASIDNADIVKLDLATAPVNRDQELNFLIYDQRVVTAPPPLPETLYLVKDSQGPSGARWTATAEAPAKPDYRLHYPGGLKLLYSDEPLLIVYGTMAWEERNAALKQVAEMMAITQSGTLPDPEGQKRDGISTNVAAWQQLPIKADVDVTAEDIQNHNLILLGDPRHNEIIQHIQKELPVQIHHHQIWSDDGEVWPREGTIMGLLHYNPLAPQRYIYWIVAEKTEDLMPLKNVPPTSLFEIQATHPAAPDFMILGASQTRLIAARRFDSHWRWEAGYKESPRFGQDMPVIGPEAVILAEAIRRQAGGDFAMTRGRDWDAMQMDARAGVTRLADVRAMFYFNWLGRMKVSGRELLDLQREIEEHYNSDEPLTVAEWREIGRLIGVPPAEDIDLMRDYLFTLESRQVFGVSRFTTVNTRNFEMTSYTRREAWMNHAAAILREMEGR